MSGNGGVLHFLSSLLSEGRNVVVMTRAVAAVLDHEVESMGREQQSIKKGAWAPPLALPALHSLFLKSFVRNSLMVSCLSHCYFGGIAGFFTNRGLSGCSPASGLRKTKRRSFQTFAS